MHRLGPRRGAYRRGRCRRGSREREAINERMDFIGGEFPDEATQTAAEASLDQQG
jgi:hypothetical protein